MDQTKLNSHMKLPQKLSKSSDVMLSHWWFPILQTLALVRTKKHVLRCWCHIQSFVSDPSPTISYSSERKTMLLTWQHRFCSCSVQVVRESYSMVGRIRWRCLSTSQLKIYVRRQKVLKIVSIMPAREMLTAASSSIVECLRSWQLELWVIDQTSIMQIQCFTKDCLALTSQMYTSVKMKKNARAKETARSCSWGTHQAQ